MGLHGIPQLIDALNCGVGGRIKADTVVGAADIIVDGSRDANNIDPVFTQSQSSPERSVSADGDNAVQTEKFAGLDRFALTRFRHELLAPGGVKDRASAVDGVSNTLFIQSNHISSDQSIPSPANAKAFNTVVDGGADNCTNTGIHARGVATTGEDADSFHTHMDPPIRLPIWDTSILTFSLGNVKMYF